MPYGAQPAQSGMSAPTQPGMQPTMQYGGQPTGSQPMGSAPAAPGGAAATPERLPLMRPKKGRMLAGVCKGVSLHIGVGVGWIRLITILSCICYGAGAIAYILLWIVVPAGDPYEEAARQQAMRHVGNAPLAAPLASPVPSPFAAGTQRTQGAPKSPSSPSPYAATQAASAPPKPFTANGAREAAPAQGDAEEQSAPAQALAALKNAPKPALFALAGALLLGAAFLAAYSGVDFWLWAPLAIAIVGIGVAWLPYHDERGHARAMVAGMALIFGAYSLLMAQAAISDGMVPLGRSVAAGLGLLVCVGFALVPWITALVRRIGTERASKEREEERADMAAHLHDGVLQTLALIQLNAADPQQVFTLARSQERELRGWLYQERTTSDRSVAAGIEEVAAQTEQTFGVPIDVVTVGDAEPSAQTDALLGAAQQALVNAATHGAEPISVYCEAGDGVVEVFVRDHGPGFDIHAIPEGRLGIRESIIGRMERRGGTTVITSRPNWGTEVHLTMPVASL